MGINTRNFSALKYGGGGHKNAAGFITEILLNF